MMPEKKEFDWNFVNLLFLVFIIFYLTLKFHDYQVSMVFGLADFVLIVVFIIRKGSKR